jgi:hypothetical protein
MAVSGQFRTPVAGAYPLGRHPGANCTWGCGGPPELVWTVWNRETYLAPTGIRTPDRSVTILTELARRPTCEASGLCKDKVLKADVNTKQLASLPTAVDRRTAARSNSTAASKFVKLSIFRDHPFSNRLSKFGAFSDETRWQQVAGKLTSLTLLLLCKPHSAQSTMEWDSPRVI